MNSPWRRDVECCSLAILTMNKYMALYPCIGLYVALIGLNVGTKSILQYFRNHPLHHQRALSIFTSYWPIKVHIFHR